jgi:ABC-2 type transport system permease protein
MGLLFVASLLSSKQAVGHSWVLAGLSLIGGVYFPIALFPSWIRWMSEVQPFTPAVDLLRHFLVATPTHQAVWLELVKLIAFVVVLVPVASSLLWFSVKAARRRGTIMEF